MKKYLLSLLLLNSSFLAAESMEESVLRTYWADDEKDEVGAGK
jgi:hypothetical protein